MFASSSNRQQPTSQLPMVVNLLLALHGKYYILFLF